MGLTLIIFALISVIGKIFYLLSMMNYYQKLIQVYSGVYMKMPFWAEYYWILIIFLAFADILIFIFGYNLYKHHNLEKKYLYFSILLLVFLTIIGPILLGYSAWPLLTLYYHTMIF